MPVRTPPEEATLRYVADTAGAGEVHGRHRGCGDAAGVRDVDRELEGLLGASTPTMARHRTGIKLVDRCAADYPELARLWFAQGREAVVAAFRATWRPGAGRDSSPPIPDVAVAARLVVETIVFWAVHRHWDPAPQPVEERAAEASVVQLLTNTFLAGRPA